MRDEDFARAFESVFGAFEAYSFPSKIAGVTHANKDSTSRQALLMECEAFDMLDLVPEPGNPVDPKAVAVYRHANGKQLGYLPERTAHDLLAQMKEPGTTWFAVFREVYRSENNRSVVGALIRVVCADVEKLKRYASS